MSTVEMRKLQLLLLKSDIEQVLTYLASTHKFQIITPASPSSYTLAAQGSQKNAEDEIIQDQIALRLEKSYQDLVSVGNFLGYKAPEILVEGTKIPEENLFLAIDAMSQRCDKLEVEIASAEKKSDELKDSLREAKAFAGMSVPFDDLNKFSFITIRVGKIESSKQNELAKALGDRALILPVGNDGTIVAVASKRGRFNLETELNSYGFIKKSFPTGFQGVPEEAISAMEKAMADAKDNVSVLHTTRDNYTKEYSSLWPAMISSVRIGRAIKQVEKSLEGTEWAYRLDGWMPLETLKKTVSGLESMLGNRLAIQVFNPEEPGGEGSVKKEDVPVLLRNGPITSAFRPMVLSYGTPLYGDIDPTPIVAVSFTLLFSIMFGDLGQGALILATGIAMLKAKRGFLLKYKKFAAAFMLAGTGSMFMGLLVGSCFGSDTLLVPLERLLTGLILGRPMDRFLGIMPSSSVKSMFTFFEFTLGIGVVINSIGIILNIVGNIKHGETYDGIMMKTGVAGLVFFWWALGMGLRVALGHHLGWYDIIGLGVPLLAMMIAEPLKNMIVKRKGGEGENQGLSEVLIGALVNVIETVSYYISNTLSFLRVAAFAVAHGVLSMSIFILGDMLRKGVPGGIVFDAIMIVIGNAIVLGLEGLIVTIQVIRLQYYEFFSKFFTRYGRIFKPLNLE
jgi:V/A-type H+-transporting ATPase subunit I